MKKTLVIGASENPARVSNTAIRKLVAASCPVEAIGLRVGKVGVIPIQKGLPVLECIDTVTLYVGKKHQSSYYDYIISLKPQRVIFNPGTENPEFQELLKGKGIEAFDACTLVMLSMRTY